MTASPRAKEKAVNVGNTKEANILELVKKVKEVTKCKSAIEVHPRRRVIRKGAAQKQVT
ncbi:MAG: hypothetical protein ABSA79_05665 [Candidatus Bathyarchaeia archaeon]